MSVSHYKIEVKEMHTPNLVSLLFSAMFPCFLEISNPIDHHVRLNFQYTVLARTVQKSNFSEPKPCTGISRDVKHPSGFPRPLKASANRETMLRGGWGDFAYLKTGIRGATIVGF